MNVLQVRLVKEWLISFLLTNGLILGVSAIGNLEVNIKDISALLFLIPGTYFANNLPPDTIGTVLYFRYGLILTGALLIWFKFIGVL